MSIPALTLGLPAMVTRPLALEPATRIELYYQYSRDALKAAIAAHDFQMATGFLSLAVEWSALASQVQQEQESQADGHSVSEAAVRLAVNNATPREPRPAERQE